MISSKLLLVVTILNVVIAETTLERAQASAGKPNDTDSMPQDLYVIKTVVYEVGILTDAGNDTDNTNDTHEQVDVSFFDPTKNGSGIDLTKIPLPIQTNVSGVSVTGLLPAANLASILLSPVNGLPVLPNKQVTVTQNISTTNPDKSSAIISNLPTLLGLTNTNNTSNNTKDKILEKKEDSI